jgi:colicin import membrane protein
MRTGLAISSVGHAVLLGWGLITFAPNPLEAPPTEAMPIDIVPMSEITQNRAGKRTAPKLEDKPAAEKVAEPKPQVEPEKKTPPKPEPKTAAVPPPPPPPPLDPELKGQAKPDPIKEALAKEAQKKPPPPPHKQPPKAADAAKANTPKQRDFNPDKIAALLDKREPERRQATGEMVSPTASLGTSSGNAPRLTQSEIDALRAQIQACWNPPIGAENAQQLIVRLRIQFRSDGTLSREPELLNRGASTYFQVAAESAMRAVRRCQPYTLPAAKYDIWKDVEVTFDPRDMFGGG